MGKETYPGPKQAKFKAGMGQKQTNQAIERLIFAYWQIHRRFDANINDLARYTRVSWDYGIPLVEPEGLSKKQDQVD